MTTAEVTAAATDLLAETWGTLSSDVLLYNVGLWAGACYFFLVLLWWRTIYILFWIWIWHWTKAGRLLEEEAHCICGRSRVSSPAHLLVLYGPHHFLNQCKRWGVQTNCNATNGLWQQNIKICYIDGCMDPILTEQNVCFLLVLEDQPWSLTLRNSF